MLRQPGWSHKLPLLVIGKFKNPRWFKGVGTLPVNYEANKKAWMNGELFIKWLTDFDTKINLENEGSQSCWKLPCTPQEYQFKSYWTNVSATKCDFNSLKF